MTKLTPKLPEVHPQEFFGFAIWQISSAWESFMNDALKPYHLNQSECFFLVAIVVLTQKQNEVTQIELARYVSRTPMHTSLIVRKLETKKLVKRIAARDSRAKGIQLAPRGFKLLQTLVHELPKLNEAFFAQSSADAAVATYLKSFPNSN